MRLLLIHLKAVYLLLNASWSRISLLMLSRRDDCDNINIESLERGTCDQREADAYTFVSTIGPALVSFLQFAHFNSIKHLCARDTCS